MIYSGKMSNQTYRKMKQLKWWKENDITETIFLNNFIYNESQNNHQSDH